jgi:hypothetical protein
VQGNTVGLDVAGTQPVGNGWDGVSIYDGASGNVFGLAVNGSGAANTIAFNSSAGIVLFDASTTGNTFRGNHIFSNGYIGINLVGGAEDFYGVNSNDAGDADFGPNNFQNYPVVTKAAGSGLNTIISGTFNGSANRTMLIDLYRNDVADSSQHGEGQRHLGSSAVTTDGGGTAAFTFTAGENLSGQYIAATATDGATGDTSEFSLALLATNGPVSPTFHSPTSLTSSGFTAQVTLTLGQNYRVQATTNLGGVPIPWIDLTNFAASVTNYRFLDRAGTNLPRRFYRVVSP